MSPAPIKRQHGPINPAFGLMWFDFTMMKVRFEPRRAA